MEKAELVPQGLCGKPRSHPELTLPMLVSNAALKGWLGFLLGVAFVAP